MLGDACPSPPTPLPLRGRGENFDLHLMLSDLRRLISAWWHVDRVRVSPRAGWLLRVHVPGLIVVCGRAVTVVGRTVGQTASGAYIEYACRTDDGGSYLRVDVAADGTACRLSWSEGGEFQEISEDDVWLVAKEDSASGGR